MSHLCVSCGKEHDELSPYFMWRLPDAALSRRDLLVFDDDFTCRIGDEQHFISCELALPFKSGELDPLGFICWVQVDRDTYNAYRAYRANEDELPPYADDVHGRLANPIPLIADSCGTAIAFRVLCGDPTPYIQWVAPDSPVAALLERGASIDFWHAAMNMD